MGRATRTETTQRTIHRLRPRPGGTGNTTHCPPPSKGSPLPPTAPAQPPRPPGQVTPRVHADAVSQRHLPAQLRRETPFGSQLPDLPTPRGRHTPPSRPCRRPSGAPRRASPSGSPWSAACSSRPWSRWRPRSQPAEPRLTPPGHNFRSLAPEGGSL